MQVHHRFTRLIYEYMLYNDHLPFPSILPPHQPYSHPKAGVCIYERPIDEYDGFFGVQVGDITYVLEYKWSMCPREYLIDLHSLILLHIICSLGGLKMVGWFQQSPQGDVVSQCIDNQYLHITCMLNCEYTYIHALRRTLIAEPRHFISTDSNTAWLDYDASS